MCKCSSEDVDLLLLLYLVVICLWCEILRWLGLHWAMPGTVMEQVPLKQIEGREVKEHGMLPH